MPDTDNKELAILNEFMERMRAVNRAKDPTWNTTINTVAYGPFVKDSGFKTPGLFAEVAFWRDEAQTSRNIHEAELDIRFTGHVADVRDPATTALLLFDDMKRIVHEAESDRLNNLVMWIGAIDAELGTERYQGAGRCTVVMTVRARYRWEHS